MGCENCETCNALLDWYSGYYGRYSKCPNFCVKCEQSCYGFCECSKRRWECKECKFCETKVTLDETMCDVCCEECKGKCQNKCESCEVNCETECDCEIDCKFCENKLRHYDFVHDETFRCHTQVQGGIVNGAADLPQCEECSERFCWDNEGPCMKPCKMCNSVCDNECGCVCDECGTQTQEGGCKCYDEAYIAQKKEKDNRDMRKRFTDGQEIRHKLRNSIRIGKYDLQTNTIRVNTLIFDSLSGFAKAHYKSIGSTRTTVNGWKECEYKIGEEWKFIH